MTSLESVALPATLVAVIVYAPFGKSFNSAAREAYELPTPKEQNGSSSGIGSSVSVVPAGWLLDGGVATVGRVEAERAHAHEGGGASSSIGWAVSVR